MSAETALLEVEGLDVAYRVRGSTLPALRGLTLAVRPGEIVGVVGESGCGKSTLSAALLRLLPPNGAVTGGRISFDGRDVLALRPGELRELRGAGIAMVFQDPLTSLNPTFTIETQMLDVLRAHGRRRAGAGELRARAVELLEQVGIPDAPARLRDYPHQLSGGMRQRVMIAMALMLEPKLLVADEPTSALDVTLEAQILELLRRLRESHGTAILFISHDLGVVAGLCERVIVMYAGRAVEQADALSLFERPLHPYTRALLAAIPSHRRRGEPLAAIPGRVPSLSDLPAGCAFADRCPDARAVCRREQPGRSPVGGALVECHAHDPGSGYESSPPAPARPEAPA